MAREKADAPTAEDLGLAREDVNPEPTIEGETQPPETEAPTPKRRGRPPGSATKTGGSKPEKTKTRKADDMEALAKQIQGLHLMASMATGMPELAISEMEAGLLAKGISAVGEEYGLALDGKTGAAIQMFGAAAMVYGPRILMIRKRIAEKEAREAAGHVPDGIPAH